MNKEQLYNYELTIIIKLLRYEQTRENENGREIHAQELKKIEDKVKLLLSN